MDIHTDKIYQLLMLKLTDSITESDEGYINSLIESEPEVYALWKEIQLDFATVQNKKALQEFDTDSIIANVKAEVRRLKRGRRIVRIFAAVATIGISVCLYIILKDNKVENFAAKHDVTKQVQLQLTSGEQINLSERNGEQLTEDGAVTLNNTNNTFVYTANKVTNATATIIVPAGKDYHVKLEDGTKVHMNSGSKLIFPFRFSGGKREITISGEAFVEVATNAALPFIVHTQQTTIQVLGTSFNVNSYDSGKVTVALVQGSVKINEVLLKPGYAASVSSKGTAIYSFDEESELAWRNDQYIFRHSQLKEIMPVLERWYDVQIVFDNPATADKVVTGHIMRSDDIATVLNMLKRICNADYYYKNNSIHIR
jgi:ferric-dicitrate binding protein FerR (iron transport regulator)